MVKGEAWVRNFVHLFPEMAQLQIEELIEWNARNISRRSIRYSEMPVIKLSSIGGN